MSVMHASREYMFVYTYCAVHVQYCICVPQKAMFSSPSSKNCLYILMNFAVNASKWKMALVPSWD